MTPKSDDLVDPRIASTWREASNEEPSASIDAAILAAARREVSARPEALVEWQAREARASRRRWWPLAVAATVAAIAVGVLQLTPTDKLVSPASETATVSDVPAPAAKTESGAAAPAPTAEPTAPAAPPGAPPPAASTLAPFAAADPAPQPKEEKRARSDDARPKAEARKLAPPPPPAPPAAVSAAPAEPRQSAAAPSPNPFPATNAAADAAASRMQTAPSPPPAPQRSEAAGGVARESDSVARPAAAPLAKVTERADQRATDEARAKDRKPLPVPDWIALIRRLRAEGKQDEAAKELAAFRAAHPNHEKLLPPDLRDWRPPEK